MIALNASLFCCGHFEFLMSIQTKSEKGAMTGIPGVPGVLVLVTRRQRTKENSRIT